MGKRFRRVTFFHSGKKQMNCIKIQFADFTKNDQKINREAGVFTEKLLQRKKNLQSHRIAFIIHINNFKNFIAVSNILSHIKAIKFHRAMLARPRGRGVPGLCLAFSPRYFGAGGVLFLFGAAKPCKGKSKKGCRVLARRQLFICVPVPEKRRKLNRGNSKRIH